MASGEAKKQKDVLHAKLSGVKCSKEGAWILSRFSQNAGRWGQKGASASPACCPSWPGSSPWLCAPLSCSHSYANHSPTEHFHQCSQGKVPGLWQSPEEEAKALLFSLTKGLGPSVQEAVVWKAFSTCNFCPSDAYRSHWHSWGLNTPCSSYSSLSTLISLI